MDEGLFVPFRFRVNLYSPDRSQILCGGYFSEVAGFEATMEPRAIVEGGRNWGELQRSGPVKFAPLVLKRGVTTVNDLWSWFDLTTRGANYGYRLSGDILVLGGPGTTIRLEGGERRGVHNRVEATENIVMTWQLTGVLPTKFKGPDLSATASQVAIEEVQLVHEGLELVRPVPAGGTGENTP